MYTVEEVEVRIQSRVERARLLLRKREKLERKYGIKEEQIASLAGVEIFVVQQKPYTMVNLFVKFDGKWYHATSFAKANPRDKYSKSFGVNLCIHRSIKKIARYVADGETAEPVGISASPTLAYKEDFITTHTYDECHI